MIYTEKKIPTAADYNSLRIRVGWQAKALTHATKALENSLFIASIWDDETIIGFGRITGDGALSFVVNDIMVDPDYRGKGYAKQIMATIDEYLQASTDSDAIVILLADVPANKLYEQFGFENPEPQSIGMKRRQE